MQLPRTQENLIWTICRASSRIVCLMELGLS